MHGNAMKRLVTLTVPCLLAACASLKYTPVVIDTPMPLTQTKTLCTHNAQGELARLEPGKRCMAPVSADAALSRVPLAVQPGDTYRILVPEGQVWYDASLRYVAPAGDRGSAMQNIFRFMRRNADSNWFALMAANVAAAPGSDQEFEVKDIQQHDVVDFGKPGQLAFYPNDARHFYGNNQGRIWVVVMRCAEDRCKDAVP
jgi:hypothetical protein